MLRFAFRGDEDGHSSVTMAIIDRTVVGTDVAVGKDGGSDGRWFFEEHDFEGGCDVMTGVVDYCSIDG